MRPPFAASALAALLLLAALPSSPAATAIPAKPFVVIAVVDTGVNPYHQAFRGSTYPLNVDADATNDVDFNADPATWLPGYPSGATRVDLSLGAASYDAALTADRPKFDAMSNGKLYWFPGTKIIGAYDGGGTFGSGDPTQPAVDDIHIVDEQGHGTATASLAAGNLLSEPAFCRACLLVVVEGPGGENWALSQSWIDVVSNSWGTVGNVGFPTAGLIGSSNDPGRAAAERGQTVLFASGNGVENAFIVPEQTYASGSTGPSWYVRVGGVGYCAPGETFFCDAPINGAGKPADVVAAANGAIRAADYQSLAGGIDFSGTSAATPIAASYFGHVLLTLRTAMGDASVGQRARQVVAQGTPITGTPFASPAADGKVTRQELWDLAFGAASPQVNQSVYPGVPVTATPADYTLYGWGIANGGAVARADAAALGRLAVPGRDDVTNLLRAVDKNVQERMWGTWDRNGDGVRDSYQGDLVAAVQGLGP